MSREELPDRSVDIAVPFYRNSHLVFQLFQSLTQAPAALELTRLGGTLFAVNDSPDDLVLKEQLQSAVSKAALRVRCELLENPANIGFTRSVNLVMQRALDQGHDVIILNSDALVLPGAFSEMRNVAYLDPMIGFVSPRSNNATICSLPHQESFKPLLQADSLAVFNALKKYLPRFHFVPVAVGFCLFIKWEVLKEFGLFDEAYSPGYNEENDLIMRANRCGYRAALANRAWAYHVGEASFSTSASPKQVHEERTSRLLNQRFPEYMPSIRRYFRSERYEAEQLLVGMLPADREGPLDLLFDLSSMGPLHNGTFVASKKILEGATRLWPQFNLHVMVSDEARRFHQLDQLPRVSFVPLDVDRKFAVGFRFGQPFALQSMSRLSRLAVVNIYGMLDPIALDCLYLNNSSSFDLETLWAAVFAHADGVIYISDFVSELFRRRFRRRPGLHELIAYPSLDVADYKNGFSPSNPAESHILVIGNRFEHKRLSVTVDALSQAFPNDRIVAVGSDHESGQNVVSLGSGYLDAKEMHDLFSGARFVVFPSLYEGFGFPVIESIAYQKPVLARSIPVMRAIRDKIGDSGNLILYSSTSELIERLRQDFPTWRCESESTLVDQPENWDSTTLRIGDFLQKTVRELDFENVLLPRIDHVHLLEQRTERDAQLEEVYASWSWRLTSPVRWLGAQYLRAAKSS
jgi:GT2 family glycosyltransferase